MCPEKPKADHPINKKELLSDHIEFEDMNAYIDGVLEMDEFNRIENHLVRCEACHSLYDEIQSLFEDLENLNSCPVEIDIVSDVMENLNSEFKFPDLLKWGSIIQTSIVLVGLSILAPISINQKLLGAIHQIVRFAFQSMGKWFLSILSILPNWIFSILEFQPRPELIQFFSHFHLSDLSLWAVILLSIILCIGANVLLLRGSGRIKPSENIQI